jgi:uncharacterized protein (TIGR03435 family)
LAVVGAMGCVVSAVGQTAAPAASPAGAKAYVPTMTFDVASVRENKDADLRAGITMSGQFVPHTTNLRLINWRIESILSAAYGVDEWQVVGAPKWPFPMVFVIEAKGDGDADAKMAALPVDEQRMEQQHMLQALLADRFKLKTHWETKEGDVYNLVVAKGGPKLGAEGSTSPSAEELKNFGDRPVLPLYQKNDGRGYDFIGHACPMSYLVGMLTGQFGRPVVDKTELTGKYDFVVKYKDRWDRDRRADDMDPTPPLDPALQDELGLKLEPAKGPVKMLVIDHVEKPSEN